jgi:hypothetical protein
MASYLPGVLVRRYVQVLLPLILYVVHTATTCTATATSSNDCYC